VKRVIAVLCLCSCATLCSCAGPEERDETKLERACLRAAVRAIDAEIERHKAWLKRATDPERKSELQKQLTALYADKDKHQRVDPADYRIPKKLSLTGQYEGQIHFRGQSRSGPFYHVIGSATPLEKGKMYAFEFYLVYRRSYWHMTNYYVYVSRAEKSAEKRIF